MLREGRYSTVLGEAKVMAFVATADPERAKTFYRDVLGLRLEGLPQDGRGIWGADARTRVWWCKDPDGNTLSLTQFSAPG
jgi:hypothetical protein